MRRRRLLCISTKTQVARQRQCWGRSKRGRAEAGMTEQGLRANKLERNRQWPRTRRTGARLRHTAENPTEDEFASTGHGPESVDCV